MLASRNQGKLREIRQVLSSCPGVHIAGLEELDEIPEPIEDGQTFAQNARKKALHYARATGQWCLADDSGLAVDALGGLPGVHSARYAADCCPPDSPRGLIDQANNQKLLEALADVSDERRTARFVCHLVLARTDQILIETFDAIEGRILRQPKGSNGFGYDPLFFVPEQDCTTAQLPPEMKNKVSHRGKALRRFAELLEDLLRRSKA